MLWYVCGVLLFILVILLTRFDLDSIRGGMMGAHGRSSRGETSLHSRKSGHSRQAREDDLLSDPASDESPSRSSHKHRDRGRSKSRSSRRAKDSDHSTDDSDREHSKRRSSRKITEEEIAEYLAKKAQRKVILWS